MCYIDSMHVISVCPETNNILPKGLNNIKLPNVNARHKATVQYLLKLFSQFIWLHSFSKFVFIGFKIFYHMHHHITRYKINNFL